MVAPLSSLPVPGFLPPWLLTILLVGSVLATSFISRPSLLSLLPMVISNPSMAPHYPQVRPLSLSSASSNITSHHSLMFRANPPSEEPSGLACHLTMVPSRPPGSAPCPSGLRSTLETFTGHGNVRHHCSKCPLSPCRGGCQAAHGLAGHLPEKWGSPDPTTLLSNGIVSFCLGSNFCSPPCTTGHCPDCPGSLSCTSNQSQ